MNPSVLAQAVATLLGIIGVSTVTQTTVRTAIVAAAVLVVAGEQLVRYFSHKTSVNGAVAAKVAQAGIANATALAEQAKTARALVAPLPTPVGNPVHPPIAVSRETVIGSAPRSTSTPTGPVL